MIINLSEVSNLQQNQVVTEHFICCCVLFYLFLFVCLFVCFYYFIFCIMSKLNVLESDTIILYHNRCMCLVGMSVWFAVVFVFRFRTQSVCLSLNVSVFLKHASNCCCIHMYPVTVLVCLLLMSYANVLLQKRRNQYYPIFSGGLFDIRDLKELKSSLENESKMCKENLRTWRLMYV